MNHRRGAFLLLCALLACRQGGEGREPLVSPPAPAAIGVPWPPAVVTGTIGRGARPTRAAPAPVAAPQGWPPVTADRVWSVPGGPEDPALAVVSGTIGETLVVQLVDVDGGRVRWHDVEVCQAPVVHVVADAVICGDARGMRALDVATGARRWQQPFRFAGAEGGLVVGLVEGDTQVAVVDAATGDVVAEVAPPPGILAIDVRRACPVTDGVELWAWSLDGALSRFVVGASAGPAETMQLARAPARVEACEDPVLVELPIAGTIERDLLAISRSPVAVMGGPVVERGFWRRAGGEIGVATARGIEARGPALEERAVIDAAQVGRELAARGARRLVRGAAGLPVLLEDDRPVAYLSAPANPDSAVLGDRFVVGGGWLAPARTLADRAQRFALPAAGGIVDVPPIVARAVPEAPVESRDLPEPVPPAGSLDLPGAGAHGVGVVAVDPVDPALVYTTPLEERPSARRGAGIAALDVRARRWRWHSAEGCPPGSPVAIAVARDVLVCGSRGSVAGLGAVRAISRDGGTVLWTRRAATVDALSAGGDLVVVTVGREALILDAATGAELARWASDDGLAPRVVPARVRDTDVVVGVERGAVVARLPRAGMLPLWGLSVEGHVAALGVAGDRITVELASGELYVVDPADGTAVAAAGWARRWRPVADLVLAEPLVPAGAEWELHGYGVDGAPRFATGLAVEPPWLVGARGRDPAAPLALAYGPAARQVAVVDPRTGEVRARVTLPDRAVPGAAFATVVDGAPVAGAILAQPLGAVLF